MAPAETGRESACCLYPKQEPRSKLASPALPIHPLHGALEPCSMTKPRNTAKTANIARPTATEDTVTHLPGSLSLQVSQRRYPLAPQKAASLIGRRKIMSVQRSKK